MTKAEVVNEIASRTNVNKDDTLKIVETFMEAVKDTLNEGENVYLRGFGTFQIKHRAEKTARNISKNSVVIIPAHNIPAFKPSKYFVEEVKLANS
ncbi:MAG TPA: HU family DNA-binding protein [Tangfeifania sp.]|nr:HU family DNA-binding protein [Tangfeifania sp.]